jgi:hypothetical protein
MPVNRFEVSRVERPLRAKAHCYFRITDKDTFRFAFSEIVVRARVQLILDG